MIKLCGNNVDFSTSEITPKKVRGNNVDFSASEITSKKVRQNLVFDVSTKYRRRIDVDSTWSAR